MIDDSVALLRSRFAELGIEFENPADILNKANEIAMRHKELRAQSTDLQNQVIIYILLLYGSRFHNLFFRFRI